MMEDELVKIWQSSPNREQLKFEKSRFMLDLQTSLDRLQRSWKYMEWREVGAALIVIPVFAYKAYVATNMLVTIGCIWIVLSGIFIIYRLLAVRKYKPSSLTQTYNDYLHKSKHHLTIQRNLLNSVMYWYFAPIAIGILLVFIGSIDNIQKLALNILGLIIMGIVVYYLNKRAARKFISPRLEKIDELIQVMEE